MSQLMSQFMSQAMPQAIAPATGSISTETGVSVAKLLGQHYGDRSVYLQDSNDRALLKDAFSLGLVTIDGQLTTTGYAFWQSWQRDQPG